MSPDWNIKPSPIGRGQIINERWLFESGVDKDGDPGASVTDLSPGRDDASEVQYAFKRKGGVMVLFLVGVHRHEMAGECEHVPADQYGNGVPDEATDIVAKMTDAPVAKPNDDQ